jgi:hypothetical protein
MFIYFILFIKLNDGIIIENDKVRLGGPSMHEDTLKQIEHLIILGCGTSLNAGQHSINYFTPLKI